MENNQSKEKDPGKIQKNESPKKTESEFEEVDVSGTDEDSYKAATHGTEIETHEPHPTKVPHPREETGRRTENTTKP